MCMSNTPDVGQLYNSTCIILYIYMYIYIPFIHCMSLHVHVNKMMYIYEESTCIYHVQCIYM